MDSGPGLSSSLINCKQKLVNERTCRNICSSPLESIIVFFSLKSPRNIFTLSTPRHGKDDVFPTLKEGEDLHVKIQNALPFILWGRINRTEEGDARPCIDSDSMATNICQHNKPVCFKIHGFKGIKWPCCYQQIILLTTQTGYTSATAWKDQKDRKILIVLEAGQWCVEVMLDVQECE